MSSDTVKCPLSKSLSAENHCPVDLEPLDQYTLEIKRKFLVAVIMVKTSLVTQTVKNLPTVQETGVQSLSREDPLEKGMVTHSSALAWRILWTEEPGRLQSMGRKESDTTEPLARSPSFHGKARIQLGIKNWDIFQDFPGALVG